QNGGARPDAANDLRDAGGSERPELGRSEAAAGLDNGLSGASVLPARTYVVTGGNGIANFDCVVMLDNILEGDDGICSVRNDAARRDPHRLPGAKLAGRRSSRRNPERDGQPARRVDGAEGEAVHRRARKRRQVDRRARRLGQNPSRGLLEGEALVPEWANALKDQALSVFDRQQVGQNRRIRYARWIGSRGRDLGRRPRSRRGADGRASVRRTASG